MKKIISSFLLGLIVFVLSCNKDESNDTPSNSGTYSITLAGQINDENGLGIPNVAVQVGNKTVQTDGNGIYLIEKASVNKSRAVVKATRAGYWDRSCGFIPSNSTVQYCNMVMPRKAAPTSIQSSAGGTVTNTGATITFPSNAFVNAAGMLYNGVVNITSRHLPTTDPNFDELIPGGDLMAENNSGSSVILVSYGMIGVELKDNNGNPLLLAPGVKATIQLPIASSQLAVAPAAIPLWYFDETKNLWVEEGIATKVGNKYVGEVAHFSWWNCDEPTLPATISGYLYDSYGNPIVNAEIYHKNRGGVYTNQNGFYSGLIPAGITGNIYATYQGVSSQILAIPALTSGQFYDVPDLIFTNFSFGLFKAVFVDCENNPASSYIKFSLSTTTTFIYVPNGIVKTLIKCGTQKVNASNAQGYFDSTFIQPCLPDSLDLDTIVICNANNSKILFKVNLNSSILNINFSEFNPGVIFANVQNDSNIYIDVTSSLTQENFYCGMYNFFNYTPGTYTIQNTGFFGFDYSNANADYQIRYDSLNPNINLTILQNGILGDTLELMINGTVLVKDLNNGNTANGTLTNLHLKSLRSF